MQALLSFAGESEKTFLVLHSPGVSLCPLITDNRKFFSSKRSTGESQRETEEERIVHDASGSLLKTRKKNTSEKTFLSSSLSSSSSRSLLLALFPPCPRPQVRFLVKN